MIHDFKEGQTVYLTNGKKLLSGVVSDENCNARYKFNIIPPGDRLYLSVKWNGNNGHGAPHYTSLHADKESAIQEWYDKEVEKLEKSHKRLLNTKI